MILIASERAILSRAIDVIDKPSRNPLDHRYVFAGGNPVSFVELDGHRYIVADGVYAHSITGKIVEDRRSGSNGSKSSSNEGELSSYVCIQAGCNEGNLVYPAYPPVYWEVPKAELTPEERLFLEGLSFAFAVAEPIPSVKLRFLEYLAHLHLSGWLPVLVEVGLLVEEDGGLELVLYGIPLNQLNLLIRVQ